MASIWDLKKASTLKTIEAFAVRSPALELLQMKDVGFALRIVVEFDTKTLVRRPSGVDVEGPVRVGIRYIERFLTEAPNPFDIATILRPKTVWPCGRWSSRRRCRASASGFRFQRQVFLPE